MEKRNIIVIGASAGGFEAIKRLVAGLPPDLDAAVFIVWHMSPDVRGHTAAGAEQTKDTNGSKRG